MKVLTSEPIVLSEAVNHVARVALIARCRTLFRTHGFGRVDEDAGEDERRTPAYSYTVGMSAHRLPDLILVGNMDCVARAVILQAIATDWVEKKAFSLDEVKDVITNADGSPLTLRLVEVPAAVVAAKYMVMYKEIAQGLAHTTPTKVVQVLWPDKKGRFPDNVMFDDSDVGPQPLLQYLR